MTTDVLQEWVSALSLEIQASRDAHTKEILGLRAEWAEMHRLQTLEFKSIHEEISQGITRIEKWITGGLISKEHCSDCKQQWIDRRTAAYVASFIMGFGGMIGYFVFAWNLMDKLGIR